MRLFPKWSDRVRIDTISDGKSIEEHRKKIYFFVSTIVAIPVLIGYGIVSSLSEGMFVDALLNLLVALCFLAIAILLKTTSNTRGLYRFGMASLMFLLVHNVGFGPYGESEALWLLVYPLVAFYLFGSTEGLAWIVMISLPSAVLVFLPGLLDSYDYPTAFRIALVIAFMIVIVLSYHLESLRARFNLRLETQNAELKNALAEVKKLSGLIPICSSCKKIRDDRGFWNQIDEYLHEHSEAEFSHGLCPECSKKLYPELDADED